MKVAPLRARIEELEARPKLEWMAKNAEAVMADGYVQDDVYAQLAKYVGQSDGYGSAGPCIIGGTSRLRHRLMRPMSAFGP